jgi:methionyl-tRNA synthetase
MNKFYVTTSIPYVNDQPHIGFAMELVQSDVLARYARQRGAATLFSTGTDEHGGKIAEKAAEQKVTPKQFADQISQTFRQVLPLLNISNDRFIRTTDPEHEKRAQAIWVNLQKFIYKGKYVGWYCTGDEAFFSEQVVKENKGICPAHNRPYEVKQSIESGTLNVVPQIRKNEILSVLEKGLEDISISRPNEKISWGIPVPGDNTQVMYVWFEALMNYITVLGYPDHGDFKNYWPANVQVIGKDILRFHAAIWPAMLMGLNLPLPSLLYVHGFITVADKKMSKSLGNVVSPKDIVDKYGADAFRYFFLRHIPSYGDGDFSWERLDEAYNSELADQLGNAVSRTAAMIQRYQGGVIGEIPAPEHDIRQYEDAVESFKFDVALSEVWDQVRGLNQYIDEQKPWLVAKSGDEEHLKELLSYLAGALLEIAELLVPFMPSTADKIKQVFASGLVKNLPETLFPKHDKAPVKQ